VEYLTAYEKRYELDIRRPVRVIAVQRAGREFEVVTDVGTWRAQAVISATGTWWRPFIPAVPGRAEFAGRRLHTVDYHDLEEFRGQRVLVVGGGNSGAQIAADLAETADLTWVTRRPPRYLPDEIDGRALFDIATRRRNESCQAVPVPVHGARTGVIVVHHNNEPARLLR
jgi:putative flavoprotein involved in K+ transport